MSLDKKRACALFTMMTNDNEEKLIFYWPFGKNIISPGEWVNRSLLFVMLYFMVKAEMQALSRSVYWLPKGFHFHMIAIVWWFGKSA